MKNVEVVEDAVKLLSIYQQDKKKYLAYSYFKN